MKKLIPVILLLMLSMLLTAQQQTPKGAVTTGVNYAFFGSGDVTGPCLVADYSYDINKYLALTPGVRVASVTRNSDGNYSHLSSLALNLSLTFTPLPELFDNLMLEAGGLFHRQVNNYGNCVEDETDGYYTSDETHFSVERLWGLVFSIKLNIIDNQRFVAGCRGDMLTSFLDNYYNCDGLQGGIYIGVKF